MSVLVMDGPCDLRQDWVMGKKKHVVPEWDDWEEVWDVATGEDNRCHPYPCAGRHRASAAPFEQKDIATIEATYESSIDGEKRVMLGRLRDGRWFVLDADTSVTGWDVGHASVTVSNDREELIRYGMSEDVREALRVVVPSFSPNVEEEAEHPKVDPRVLARVVEKMRQRRLACIEEAARALARRSDYWRDYGEHPMIDDAVSAALLAPLDRKRIVDYWDDNSSDDDVSLTEDELTHLTDRYRMYLFSLAPASPRERCSECDRWISDTTRRTCPVCHAPICFDCSCNLTTRVPGVSYTESSTSVCTKCVPRLPESWMVPVPQV